VTLLLLACYLLDDGAIDCAADEPCAAIDTQDSGVEGDTDTDTDTDSDTDVVGSRTRGAVVSANEGGSWLFQVVEPDQNVRLDYTAAGSVSGPVDWLDAYDAGVVVHGGQSWVVDDDGAIPSLDFGLDARDIAWETNRFLVLFPNALAAIDGDGAVWLDRETLKNGTRMALDEQGGAWVLDATDRPSVYLWNDGFEAIHPEFDDTNLRAVGLFRGPDGGPWVCSGSGGVWSVAELAAGNKSPWRLAQDLQKVTDCGYDPGSDEVILFASEGVVRLGAENRTSLWHAVPGQARGRVVAFEP
jgi:hypothetical protein